MKRILISTLGTKKHIECRYALGDWTSEPVLFLQEALIQKLCKDWTEDDRVYILCTPEAHKNNWEGRKDFGEGLKGRLGSMEIAPQVINVTIPDGKEPDENREIIQTIMDMISEDCRIFLDVSHSTRSVPLLQLVSLYCTKVVGNAEIGGIYYGPYDLLGTPEKIRQIPLEERVVPVLDLTELWKTLEFASGVLLARRAGYVEDLKLWLKTQENNEAFPESLKKSLFALCNILENIALMSYPDRQALESIENSLESFENNRGIGALYGRIVRDFLTSFRKGTPPEGFGLAEWCLSRGMVLQGCLYARNRALKTLSSLNPARSTEKDWDCFLTKVTELPELSDLDFSGPLTPAHIGVAGEVIKEGFKTLLFHRDRLRNNPVKEELAQIWSRAIRNFQMKNIPEDCRKFLEENEAATRRLARKYVNLITLIKGMLQDTESRRSEKSPGEFTELCRKAIRELEEALEHFTKPLDLKATTRDQRTCLRESGR
ncbi:CRISPR-associated DxTHG motif protein [Thermodesulforhabdus norvegica]|uniref:CRISPR-associated DxTHG motif protein n=1 Tax=Thermodesulforhabdus norvegica TaxID=39841 RepID=A0A1I4T613_9BACT|nr:TM1812 family CRISPR-associated protein [Thermodesulforhabdus norvegica]SFM72043.1 CRISPR-associated DxTHG motif protein [Thermodesulforhabdus norvegica]